MKFSGKSLRPSLTTFAAATWVAVAFCSAARSQALQALPAAGENVAVASLPAAGGGGSSSSALPDAPSAVSGITVSPDATVLRASTVPALGASGFAGLPNGNNPVDRYAMTVSPDQTSSPMPAGDKVVAGFRDLYNPINLAGSVISAGYSHVVNGDPNYGTNGEAFGKRLGASFARGATQGVFTNVVLAPILHMDPRYYVQGPGHSFGHRALYAATRVLVSRTDGGHATVNAPLLIGYAGAAAMTPLYYPQINHNFKDIATGYGGSVGGAALGFVVSEFFDDVLYGLHVKKRP